MVDKPKWLKAYNRLIESGNMPEFKNSLKAASDKAFVLKDPNGNIVVFDAVGKRFTNNREITFNSGPDPANNFKLQDEVRMMSRFIFELLQERGLKVSDPVTGLNYTAQRIRENNEFEKGSHLDLCSRYLLGSEILLSEATNVDAKLHAAYQLGDISRCLKVSHEYGQTQKTIAEKERKRGLNEIFNQLRAKKNTGAKPKELWPEFIALLSDEDRFFDDVKEEQPNALNQKTWSVSFEILPDRGSQNTKRETITYERFRRRLNEK